MKVWIIRTRNNEIVARPFKTFSGSRNLNFINLNFSQVMFAFGSNFQLHWRQFFFYQHSLKMARSLWQAKEQTLVCFGFTWENIHILFNLRNLFQCVFKASPVFITIPTGQPEAPPKAVTNYLFLFIFRHKLTGRRFHPPPWRRDRPPAPPRTRAPSRARSSPASPGCRRWSRGEGRPRRTWTMTMVMVTSTTSTPHHPHLVTNTTTAVSGPNKSPMDIILKKSFN